MKINKNYLNLADNYLFAKVTEKAQAYTKQNPDTPLHYMGIGDVTLPLVPAIIKSMEQSISEMASKETFRGYGSYQGYDFLREAISAYYTTKNIAINPDEIFISSGSKGDCTGILELFSTDNLVLIPNPTYPVYLDSNIMDGRKITFINGGKENNFLPMPDYNIDADIIYICSPNNPTGAVYDYAGLSNWVNYAIDKNAIILYDGAYESFIHDNLPSSIFEIEGARECAIEFMSFSKMAGFTGVKCSFVTIPKELSRDGQNLHSMWLRRLTTRQNTVGYIVQRGAAASLSKEGLIQIKESISYYKHNTEIIAKTLDKLGIYYTGGKNAPYIWLQCPNNMNSWDFFDYLLHNAGIVGTPGSGFGTEGEGYFRLSAFGDHETTKIAMDKFEREVKKLC